MNNSERILSAAEKNTNFIMLLEGAITKLQTTIKHDIRNYACLFHTTDTIPIFSINSLKRTITVFLGEIEYVIDIKNINDRLKEKESQNISDIEKALADEMESVIQKYFLH